MTIFSTGDSHCQLYTFCYILPDTNIHRYSGPTMKRMGYKEDNLLIDATKILNVKSDDTLIISAGEVDARCWVKVHLERDKISLNDLLEHWVYRYFEAVKSNIEKKCKVAIYSVPPPVRREHLLTNPSTGTDAERSEYTRIINRLLEKYCQRYNYLYIDLYSLYKDEEDMLPQKFSGDGVHITDPIDKKFLEVFKSVGII